MKKEESLNKENIEVESTSVEKVESTNVVDSKIESTNIADSKVEVSTFDAEKEINALKEKLKTMENLCKERQVSIIDILTNIILGVLGIIILYRVFELVSTNYEILPFIGMVLLFFR